MPLLKDEEKVRMTKHRPSEKRAMLLRWIGIVLTVLTLAATVSACGTGAEVPLRVNSSLLITEQVDDAEPLLCERCWQTVHGAGQALDH